MVTIATCSYITLSSTIPINKLKKNKKKLLIIDDKIYINEYINK